MSSRTAWRASRLLWMSLMMAFTPGTPGGGADWPGGSTGRRRRPPGRDRRCTRASRPLLRRGHVGHVLAQCRRQVDLMLLLVDQDAADLLRQGVLAQRLALPHALPVVADRLVLRLQVEAQ